MRIPPLLVVAVLALAAVSPLAAQDKRALPSGPLLKPAAETSAWQIDFRYTPNGSKPAKPAARPAAQPNSLAKTPPKRIVLTRTPALWHAAVETVDGHRHDQWCAGAAQLFQSDTMTAPLPVTKDADGVPILPDYTARDFPDMAWIAADTYETTRKINGRECLVFRKGDATVFIDAQTRYPASWKEGDEERTFTELPAPAEPLTPPPAVAAAMKTFGDDKQRSGTLPPP